MIKFLGVIAITYLFVEGASVIQFIKELFGVANESKPKNRILIVIQKLINCSMCSGFWIGLAIYQDFYMACIMSLTCEAFSRIVNKLSNIFTEL